MKVRNYLENIAGIGIFPLMALLLFFFIFLVVGFWLFFSRDKTFSRQQQLPFDDNSNPPHKS